MTWLPWFSAGVVAYGVAIYGLATMPKDRDPELERLQTAASISNISVG